MSPFDPSEYGPCASSAAGRAAPVAATAATPAYGELMAALIESRQRWRDLAILGADLLFECDPAGRLAFLEKRDGLSLRPPQRSAAEWLGRPAREMLGEGSPDPFALRAAATDLRAWLCRPDGENACFSFSVVPLSGPDGAFLGLRGAARDISADVAAAQAQAAIQRRAESLEALVRRVRQALLAPQMLATLLEAVPAALGLAGAALLREEPQPGLKVAEHCGEDPNPLLPGLGPLTEAEGWSFRTGPHGEPIGLLSAPTRVAPYRALLIWRPPGGRRFDADERHFLAALSDLLFVVLGNHMLQNELERQARTEPLTGLLNRGAFLDDLHRRLQRAGRHKLPGPAGVLLFVDLDNLKPLNDRFGHGAGDLALAAVARLLRDSARPSDLVGRLGGDEFGLWLDGAEPEVATDRATALCAAASRLGMAPDATIPSLTLSVGCAAVAMGDDVAPEILLARADFAMYAAKRRGRNGWVMDEPGAGPGAELAADAGVGPSVETGAERAAEAVPMLGQVAA